MDKPSARTGWEWLRQGVDLFRKQPGALAILFLGYVFFNVGISIVPFIGQVLPLILIPVFSVAFMQACANIDQDKPVLPSLLMIGFRRPAFISLFRLGFLYLGTAALAMLATTLVDEGVFLKLMTGEIKPDSELAKQAPLGMALLMAVAIYLPASMAFCFAAPLVFWQGMGVGKAVFYSFFAVLRALKAFVMFGLSWFGASLVLSELVVLVFGRSQAAVMLMLPLSVVLTLVLHCSVYASYRQIFGAPGQAPSAPT